jgi:hypothetical protein
VLQRVDGDVRGEVVDAVERHVPGRGVGLGGGHADEQRPGQAGTGGHRDRVDVAGAHPGRREGAADGRDHRVEVGAGRHLRHDAAEAGVLLDAGGHLVGQQLRRGAVGPDDPDPRLVARGLDAQHDHVRASRRMVCASAPLGR